MQGTRTISNPARAVALFPVRIILFVLLLIKVLLRKLILGIVLIFRAATRHSVAAIAILALLAILAYTNYSSLAGRPAASTLSASPTLPTSKTVESYVEGQIKGDATAMWAAMADELRQSFADRGGSVQQLQQSIDQAKQAGRTFRGSQYVYGKRLSDGRAIYVYILTAVAPTGQTQEVPYMFTVNAAGKIESID